MNTFVFEPTLESFPVELLKAVVRGSFTGYCKALQIVVIVTFFYRSI